MQNAGFDSVIRTLLIIFLMYYVLKFLAKIFLPIILKKVVEKASENFQQYNPGQNAPNSQNQDEIIMEQSKPKKPINTKKVGEYVDYEEID